VLNQPAGHLDPDETLTEAAIRETLEETGWDVEPTSVLGIYLYTAPSNGVTYQRVCFIAKALKHHPDYQLDDGIVGAKWLTREELIAAARQLAQRADHPLHRRLSGRHSLRPRIDPPFSLALQAEPDRIASFFKTLIESLCVIQPLLTHKRSASLSACPAAWTLPFPPSC
jgi:ADP-ribose pyrophosphatase YjhB (NUDIX family)